MGIVPPEDAVATRRMMEAIMTMFWKWRAAPITSR
jgi:hypothetical protein